MFHGCKYLNFTRDTAILEILFYLKECTGSICLAYGLESCQCIPGKTDPKTKACELCCKLPGEDYPCQSSFEWNDVPYNIPNTYSKPGTPCNDYNGYCDVFQMCREVDPSGPLATLRKMLLSEESIASFKRWIMDYWYAVLLIVLSVIALLVSSNFDLRNIFRFCCFWMLQKFLSTVICVSF